MYKKNYEAPSVPTAMIAVNKSRLKVYKNTGDMPTYYLQKGQEFQIELFNPTTDVILAKIILNGNPISQGGLVLNPGQRVFLDRYLDVAKKFLFDTYEVSNTEEVKKAIEKNGDFKVEFYRERIEPKFNPNYGTLTLGGGSASIGFSGTLNNTTLGGYSSSIPNGNAVNLTNTSGHIGTTALYSSSVDTNFFDQNASNSIPTLDSMDDTLSLDMPDVTRSSRTLKSRSKSIETGRVEQGSVSDQKVVTVDKKFEYWAFHTIEYKMLPVSQKINTVEDIQVKVYCTNCGAKLSKGHKFCGQCGTKA
jgi:hypothetical protein